MALSQITECVKGIQNDIESNKKYSVELTKRVDVAAAQNMNSSQNPEAGKEVTIIKQKIRQIESTIKSIEEKGGKGQKMNFQGGLMEEMSPRKQVVFAKHSQKIKEVQLTLEDQQSLIERLASDLKRRTQTIMENFSSEFENIKIMQDRMEREVSIISKKLESGVLRSRPGSSISQMMDKKDSPSDENLTYLIEEMHTVKERLEDAERLLDSSNTELRDRTKKMEERFNEYISGKETDEEGANQSQMLLIFMNEQKNTNRIQTDRIDQLFNVMDTRITNFEDKFLYLERRVLTNKVEDSAQQITGGSRELQGLLSRLNGRIAIFEKDIKLFADHQDKLEDKIITLQNANDARFMVDKEEFSMVEKGGTHLRTDMIAIKIRLEEINSRLNLLDAKSHDSKLLIRDTLKKLDDNNYQTELHLHKERIDILELELRTVKDQFSKVLYESYKNSKESHQNLAIVENAGLGLQQNSIEDELKKDYPAFSKEELVQNIKLYSKEILEFVKEYVNEKATNKVSIINSINRGPTEKMNAIDWVLRNVEFISEKIYGNFIRRCYEIYNKSSLERSTFFFDDHRSDLMINLKKHIVNARSGFADSKGAEKVKNKYLEVLEIALLSEFNIKQAVSHSMQDDLIQIIVEDSSGFNKERSEVCLSVLLNNSNVVRECLEKNSFARWVAYSLDSIPENLKHYRSLFLLLQKIFEYPDTTKIIVQYNQNLANQLIKSLNNTMNEIELLEENLKVGIKYKKTRQ